MATVETIQIDPKTELVLSPGRVSDIQWRVAPADEEKWHLWLDCENKWLDALERRSKGSKNTRRAYQHDVLAFFGAFADVQLWPWQVKRVHTTAWVQQLFKQGLSAATINRKVAACSSLYTYAMNEYILDDECALWEKANPFGSKRLRSKVSPYGRAVFPSTEQIAALLRQIDLTTVLGLRDLALIYGMFAMSLRVDGWRNLKWGDIHEGNSDFWIEYRYKGGEMKKAVMPKDLHGIIVLYLKAAKRWPLAEGDFVFVAAGDSARRFRRIGGKGGSVPESYDPAKQPISSHRINDLLKKYGGAAGVPEKLLHCHACGRHAGTRKRLDDGATPMELQKLLGHENIATTMIYIEKGLAEPADAYACKMGSVLPQQLKLLLKD